MASSQDLSQLLNFSARTSTFVSIDVVGSTALKVGENDQDILYTFLTYHKLVSELCYQQHGEVIHISGDGMMCRFQKAGDAVVMAIALLDALPSFNKKQNRLNHALALRIGIHTGEVLESESLASGQMISQTLDITAKLQQEAEVNHARLSEATVTSLPEGKHKLKRLGWNASLKVNVYSVCGSAGSSSGASRMPSIVRILVIEPELDEVAHLRKTLFEKQHAIFTVYTQNQAAIPLTTWKPHLTLLSLDLGWDTGWEMLSSIRASQELSGMPVIAMSRQSTGEWIQKSFRLGANGFLQKPMDATQMTKRVETVLREFYL